MPAVAIAALIIEQAALTHCGMERGARILTVVLLPPIGESPVRI